MFGKSKNSFSAIENFLFMDSTILCEVVYDIEYKFNKNKWKDLDIADDKILTSVKSLVFLDIADYCQRCRIEAMSNKSLLIKALENAVIYGPMVKVYKSLDDEFSVIIKIKDVYPKQNHYRKLKLKQIYDGLER